MKSVYNSEFFFIYGGHDRLVYFLIRIVFTNLQALMSDIYRGVEKNQPHIGFCGEAGKMAHDLQMNQIIISSGRVCIFDTQTNEEKKLKAFQDRYYAG